MKLDGDFLGAVFFFSNQNYQNVPYASCSSCLEQNTEVIIMYEERSNEQKLASAKAPRRLWWTSGLPGSRRTNPAKSDTINCLLLLYISSSQMLC